MYKAENLAIGKQRIHTNSTIRLQIPEALKTKDYTIQWLAEQNRQLSNCNILTRFPSHKNSKINQFYCTPLEYGSTIIGRLFQKNNQANNLIRQTNFGVVSIEHQLISKITSQESFDIKILLNKTLVLKGCLEIKSYVDISSQRKQFAIRVLSTQFKFDIKLGQNVRLPSNNSFFKFYDGQQKCLGISIYSQHAQFMDLVKEMKNVQVLGFYLKVSFQSRVQRDVFIFNLMKNLGIHIQELKNNIPRQIINFSGDAKQPSNQLSIQNIQGIPKKKNHSKAKEIDEQILKLLCDGSQIGNQTSLDLAEAENLLSSCKNIQINKYYLEQSFQNNERMEKKQILIQQKNKILQQLQPSLSQTIRIFKEDLSDQLNEKHKSKIKQNNIIHNETYLKNQVQILTTQIKQLIEQNKKLLKQNMRLKEENIKLRYKDIKSSSISRNNDKSLSQTKNQKANSKSPVGSHHKKTSIHNPAIKPHNAVQKHKNIESVQTMPKQNAKKYNLMEMKEDEKKLIQSSGSVILGAKNVPRERSEEKYSNNFLSSASTKDLYNSDKSIGVKNTQVLSFCRSQQKLTISNNISVAGSITPDMSEALQKSIKKNQAITMSSQLRNFNLPLTASVSSKK